MKWFHKKIVNKTVSLPWIEVYPENKTIHTKSEFESFISHSSDRGQDLKSSLNEALSFYNQEVGFANDTAEDFENKNTDVVLEDENNRSNLMVDNEIYKPAQQSLNNLSFQHYSQFKYENIKSNELINSSNSTFSKAPVIANNLPENEYSKSFREEYFPDSRHLDVSHKPVIPFQEAYLLNPITADAYTIDEEQKPEINKMTFESSPFENNSGTLMEQHDYQEDDHEETDVDDEQYPPVNQAETIPGKNNIAVDKNKNKDDDDRKNRQIFRCSVTPSVTTNDQFRIPFNVLNTGTDALEYTDPVEVQTVIEKLESTLDEFGIEARVIGMQKGPIITRYELRIPPGIKVNRILGLTEELAMALEAFRVRIEAPIPGRSTVGIEIPNKKRSTVLLGDILNHPEYNGNLARLPLPLGKDIAGNLLIEDLTRMPHILIAGTTGSGKSVAINSFITSMIISKSPAEVRMLMVDPKLVELSQYNDIPHLLHPVIADPQKAILALNWAVEEMERRYEDMAEMRARDIVSYNVKIDEQNKHAGSSDEIIPKMPYIVVLIDELGDLMMVAGKEVESSIIRLSQKARAIGIHLILATQRPSVDVITALIKANCPARIALQVAQKTDSRTILDSNGGEQLLGQGDMLFKHPSKAQLIRAQAPYVSDEEVENIVHLVKQLGKPSYIILEDPKSKAAEMDVEDEDLFDEAWQIIAESNKASASYLQRRLRIGYNRAARLIEAFEARGYIGPQIGSKPREILLHN